MQGGSQRRWCGGAPFAHACDPEKSWVNASEVKERAQPTGEEASEVRKGEESHCLAEACVQAGCRRFDVVWWREIGHLDGREERAALIDFGGLFARTTESVPLHSMADIWPVHNLDPVPQRLGTSLVPLHSSAWPSFGAATLRGILRIRILRANWLCAFYGTWEVCDDWLVTWY